MEDPSPSNPVRIEGRLDPDLSRWLWLVKWLLAIPHYIVLAVLWVAFFVLTVVAFFAILFTGRYPKGIFEFNVGVLRWTWRVAFYSYAALGTDRYPPFSLQEEPSYPATLAVAYPDQLSRGLVLVKWWLLAIPQYVIVGVFVGGGSPSVWHGDRWTWGFGGGLIGLLAVFAGVALLFTDRYPRGMFDFTVGLDRWVARVVAYAGLMTDTYPPFRLEQGGAESAGVTEGSPQPQTIEPEAAAERTRRGAGRIVLLVVGAIVALVAFAALVGGGAIVAIDQTQRDDDGFLMSPAEGFSTSTYAIASESADVDVGGAEWAVKGFLGTIRISSDSERPVFVGIAREADATRYLDNVEHVVVTELGRHEPHYSPRPGAAPAEPPAKETFWVASASGSGRQSLDWEPEDGNWTVIAMNADATRGVDTKLRIGAELDSVLWVGIGLLVAGALLAGGAALAITHGSRRRR